MLASILFAALATEFLAYALLVTALSDALTLPGALATALLIHLGIRALLLTYMFAMAWIFRMPRAAEQQLRLPAALRLFLAEFRALWVCYTLLHPLSRWLVNESPLKPASGPPVLLAHGFFCNRGYWRPLLPALRNAGFTSIYTVDFAPVTAGVDRYAQLLAQRVEQILQETGVQRVILIGHSMGGLAARAYACTPRARETLAGVITLGSPHHGTALALPGVKGNQTHMRRRCAWLNSLAESEKKTAAVPLLSIYSTHDNIVAPQDSAHLDGARNIALSGLGHLALVFAPQVQQEVVKQLLQWREAQS